MNYNDLLNKFLARGFLIIKENDRETTLQHIDPAGKGSNTITLIKDKARALQSPLK